MKTGCFENKINLKNQSSTSLHLNIILRYKDGVEENSNIF